MYALYACRRILSCPTAKSELCAEVPRADVPDAVERVGDSFSEEVIKFVLVRRAQHVDPKTKLGRPCDICWDAKAMGHDLTSSDVAEILGERGRKRAASRGRGAMGFPPMNALSKHNLLCVPRSAQKV